MEFDEIPTDVTQLDQLSLLEITFQGSTVYWFYPSVTTVQYFPNDYMIVEAEDLEFKGATAAKTVQRYLYHYDDGTKLEIQIPELTGNWQHLQVPH